MKTVIIVGAGSTLSDGINRPLRTRPPLDAKFFQDCEKIGYQELRSISSYLRNNYDLDPTKLEYDSLERIMAIIYADINNPNLESAATLSFRTLIRLFNARIASSTNDLNITNRSNLYRILAKCLSSGTQANDISIVTFNQDIQVEKTLSRIQQTVRYSSMGKLFSFPFCYDLTNSSSRLTHPTNNTNTFDTDTSDEGGIKVYKLHGSLNWFSTHTSRNVPKTSILSKNKRIYITPRTGITTNMTYSGGNRSTHTFPLIIPPVNHKSAIIHRDMLPLWQLAESKLAEAENIIIFGYSCPASDFESANLLRRACYSGTDPSSFSIIDPNPAVFHRYADVTNLDHMSYFSSCNAYITKG